MESTQPRSLRFVTHPATVVITLLAGAFVVAWSWPKVAHDPNLDNTVHYRGFRLAESGPFGPLYFELHHAGAVVQYTSLGFNPFEAHFPDGSLAGRGTCMVEMANGFPCPDIHHIDNAEFYSPDGSLAGSVRDGNGTQFLFHPNGQKQWELELKDYKRAHLRMWYNNGQLLAEEPYENGLVSGLVVGFYSNGNKRHEGNYKNDWHPVGTRRYYHEDGRIEEESEFDSDSNELQTTRYKYNGDRDRIVTYLDREIIQRIEHWTDGKLTWIEHFKDGKPDRVEVVGRESPAKPSPAVSEPAASP